MRSITRFKQHAHIAAGTMVLATVSASLHAEDFYLHLKDIPGEVATSPYAGWIALDSVGWSVTADTSWTKGTGVSIGKPVLGDLTWTQAVDTTVPSMLRKITSGTGVASAAIHYLKPTARGPVTFMQLAMTDMYFTSHGFENSAFKASTVYRTIGIGYKPVTADGKVDTQFNATWNVARSRPEAGLSPPFTGSLPGPGPSPVPVVAPPAERAYLRLDAAGSGESTAAGYENWIEVSAAAWNVGADSAWGKGGLGVGKPEPGHLTWTQGMDKSWLSMFVDITAGAGVPRATLEFVKDGPAGPVTFMQLVMESLFFTGIELDDATVSGAAVFREITQTVWAVLPDGTRGKPVAVRWNITSGASAFVDPPQLVVAGFGAGSLSPALPVPEPQRYALMLVGLGLIGAAVRRRRAQA